MLRLRQAEVAMNDGRLDEAYRLAGEPAFRAHRRGQSIIQKLSDKLVERAGEHLSSGRLDQARVDVDRAQQLAGATLAIVKAGDQIREAILKQQHEHDVRRRRVEQARARLAQGDYSVALGLVDDLQDSVVHDLRKEATLRQRDFQAACDRSRRASEHQNWQDAVDALLVAGQLQPQDAAYAELHQQLVGQLQTQLDRTFRDGRLDRTSNYLDWLVQLGVDSESLGTWRRSWQHCTRSVEEIRRLDFVGAGRSLRAARQLLGPVSWLEAAIQTASELAAKQEELWAGPLGLVVTGHAAPDTAVMKYPGRSSDSVQVERRESSPSEAFVLHVGNAHGAYVVTRSLVKIGPAGRSQRVDIPLLGTGPAATITIERLDDDYFLRAEEAVLVNGQSVTSKLLSDGDKIFCGPRSGLIFHLPCPASSSALLEVVGARMPRADTRHIILLGDTLVVGPQRQSHMTNKGMRESMIVQHRGGKLEARVGSELVHLPWGTTVEVAGLPVTVIPVERSA